MVMAGLLLTFAFILLATGVLLEVGHFMHPLGLDPLARGALDRAHYGTAKEPMGQAGGRLIWLPPEEMLRKIRGNVNEESDE